ncbi:hypothetical protein GCK32_007874 [Trichostrongylus colubriformis]|uniref:BZIP domain-containing protein n=1 Tax=Trichostrongylus colubriformis TaxID=6319 RepID=A0AAN8IIF0_TRICO
MASLRPHLGALLVSRTLVQVSLPGNVLSRAPCPRLTPCATPLACLTWHYAIVTYGLRNTVVIQSAITMLPAFAQTAFDPHTFAYTPYGYNPSLTTYGTPVSSMPPSYYQDTSYNKSESDSTPEEKKKDPMYLAKRHKNNLAAQKSRKIRRQREESITKTAELLRAENESLKSEIVQLREMITDLRKQLSSTCQAPVPTDPMRESGNKVITNKSTNADVVFTRERCDRTQFGLQPIRGQPSRYRQCGPNGRVWNVPCMPGALFDPLSKVCKEMAQASPTLHQKPVDARRRTEQETIPITEEFVFSTRRPKRPRPKTKGWLSTVPPVMSLPASYATTPLPTPSPLTSSNFPTALLPMATMPPPSTAHTAHPRPYSPVFTPPDRKIATFATAPPIHPTLWPASELTQSQRTMGEQPPNVHPDTLRPIPISESHMTKAYPISYAATNQGRIHPELTSKGIAIVEQTGNNQDNERDLLHELLRLVKAHQVAINGIQEENKASGTPVEILGGNRPGGTNTFGDQTEYLRHANELQKRIELDRIRLETQRQNEMFKQIVDQQERERLVQQELARQTEERIRKDRQEWERQQVKLRQIEERRKKEMEELERQRQIAQQIKEREENEGKEEQRQKKLMRLVEEDRKKEMDERERQQEIARQMEERRKKEREELERQQRTAWETEEKQRREREEKERQRQLARQIEEKQEKERQERERQQKIYLQIEEKQKAEREEREKKQKLAWQIEERQKKEEEDRRRQQKMAQEMEERQKKERAERERQQQIAKQIEERQKKEREEQERQQEIVRQTEERKKKEREEQEKQQQRELEEQERRTELELQRLEAERIRHEEEWRKMEELTRIEDRYGIIAAAPTIAGQDSEHENGFTSYGAATDLPNANMGGKMSAYNELESAVETNNIVYVTRAPATTPPTIVEWVTSPRSWRPSPDPNLNQPKWITTTTTESPSSVTYGCSLSDDCHFRYEQDLLCAHPTELPSSAVKSSASSVFGTPPPHTIYETIDSFPQDLLPFNRNTISQAHYETENVDIASPLIDPPFPRVQPYFTSPFNKQRDGSAEDFVGGFIKPVIKKIALDQAETFLDQILSDEVVKDDSTNTLRLSSNLSEDGWKAKSG